MDKNERLFPCEKSIVINAIYDALDAIGFQIGKANSGRGTLIVSANAEPEIQYRIALTPNLTSEETAVEVFSLTGADTSDEWVSALFDEMKAILRKAGMEEPT